MTYVLFVCLTILVGISLFRPLYFLWHLTLSARIVQFPQLSRFLEMRKITPALRLARHSQSIQGSVRGVGMVGSSFEKTRVDSSTSLGWL
jgi:hypothetical protein